MDRKAIITLPNPHLRERSKRIPVVNDETKKLIHNMELATLDWEDNRPHELGVALAAVQIDQLVRAVIVRNDFEHKEDRTFFALLNPEITKFEGEPEYEHEGCLSVKDIYGLVPRYPKIRVRAMDISGREIRLKAQGFLARVLQHEIDHTNGVVFIDHIKDADAFFRLNGKGELEKIDHEQIKNSDILWQ